MQTRSIPIQAIKRRSRFILITLKVGDTVIGITYYFTKGKNYEY